MRTNQASTKAEKITNAATASRWTDTEVEGCNFKDVRLAKRFGKLLGMMSEGMGESVPYASSGLGPYEGGLTAFCIQCLK